jgi:hypothetical protein
VTDKFKFHFVNLPDEIVNKLNEFCKSIELEYIIVDSVSEADITIDKPSEREISKPEIMHAGGRISCPVAFAIGKKLGISRANAGKLANVLEMKIFGCQLGCFK